MCQALWKDDRGLVLSAELIIIVTVVVLGLITGLACVQQAVVAELQDVSGALRGLNQSYATPQFWGCAKIWGRTSWTAGSRFTDTTNGFVAPGYANADLGVGRGGLILESAPSTTVVPEGCTTCPPNGYSQPAPSAIAPIPECTTCPPNASPRLESRKPIIPQGPAPQILPQM
ncbi:hypothetical protein GC163_12740 [bacterium]|nr:hypothetical protein [bacterium]